jgi:two-component system, LytTR family, response regulator
MITALIIDDELKSIALTKLMLEKHCEHDVEILGTATDIDTAFDLIITLKPQLLFLDVQLFHSTGFDLLLKFNDYFFQVIFITAYSDFALQALKHSAIDYLLKPITADDLINAVQKAKKAIRVSEKNFEVEHLLNLITKPNNKSNKIAIAHEKGFTMVPVENIMYLEASSNYSIIHCINNQKLMVSTTLNMYEAFLNNYNFYRIHHSFIVNKDYILNYFKGEGGEVELTNQVQLPVSRRKKIEFLSWLQQ